jgi:Protein of unknown function (DUF2934)
MAKPTDKEITNRAYEIWERNGRPEGRDEEFWRLAASPAAAPDQNTDQERYSDRVQGAPLEPSEPSGQEAHPAAGQLR